MAIGNALPVRPLAWLIDFQHSPSEEKLRTLDSSGERRLRYEHRSTQKIVPWISRCHRANPVGIQFAVQSGRQDVRHNSAGTRTALAIVESRSGRIRRSDGTARNSSRSLSRQSKMDCHRIAGHALANRTRHPASKVLRPCPGKTAARKTRIFVGKTCSARIT
jgi:hypothetical protein